MKNDKIYN